MTWLCSNMRLVVPFSESPSLNLSFFNNLAMLLRRSVEKRPPQAAASRETCGAALAGLEASAIEIATAGAPAVEQSAHHGVAGSAKAIEAAGHGIDWRIVLGRPGKTER